MNTMMVYAECEARGITIALADSGDTLKVWALDPALLTEELVAAITENKAEILEGKLSWQAWLNERAGRYSTDDPRPELPGSADWSALFYLAHDLPDREAFGVLRGLRCLGAGLGKGPDGWHIVPGEIEEEEYARIRRDDLLPRKGTLVGLFARLDTAPRPIPAPEGLQDYSGRFFSDGERTWHLV